MDKPGAAQSTFAIGLPGPPRTTPDYFAILTGDEPRSSAAGRTSARGSECEHPRGEGLQLRRAAPASPSAKGPGAFQAGGDIVSPTKSRPRARRVHEGAEGDRQGERPITDEQLTTAKDSLNQRLPGQFASVAGINGAITSLWVQGLPEDYYQTYAAKVSAVTKADLLRVAKQYIDLDHLAIVIVGDRASIEASLKATNIAPIVVVDQDGAPVR